MRVPRGGVAGRLAARGAAGHASLFDPRDPEAIAAAIEWLLTAGPPRAGEDWRRFTWAECARVHRAAYALAAAG